VLQARSPGLAAVIARLLNGEAILPRDVERPSPAHTYSVTRAGRSPEQYYVIAVQSSRSNPNKFGDGAIAATLDENLADEVAGKLNGTDPRSQPAVTRGFGWF
jgi:hypothetical protein